MAPRTFDEAYEPTPFARCYQMQTTYFGIDITRTVCEQGSFVCLNVTKMSRVGLQLGMIASTAQGNARTWI